MRVDQIYQWLINSMEENGCIIENDIEKKLGSENLEHALLFLNYLVSRNLVSLKIVGNAREYAILDVKQIKNLIGYEKKPKKEYKPIEIEECLVVNVPLSLEPTFHQVKSMHPEIRILSMKDAFKVLFDVSKEEVSLSMPFFEFDGLTYFVDELKNLAKRDVSIRILSRDILVPDREGFNYLNKLRALFKLINLFESNKSSPTAQLEIKDYSVRISDHRSGSLHYEGIHQKMIVTDRRYAYVGSGEIRAASFLMNGDVGVIQIGKNAEFWADFFDLFWKHAQTVPLEFFERAIRT